MADPLQALMQLVQGGGQAAPPPPPMAQGGNDPAQMLKQLLGGGDRGTPPGGNPMSAAIMDRMGTAQAGSPAMPQMQGGGRPVNYGAEGTGMMPGMGDEGYLQVAQANQGVRGDLPPKYSGPDYTGYAEEMEPQADPRQTPKPMSTQEELDDVSNKMGGTPEDNGDFPSQKEINALNAGKIDPKAFDRKWGKGAAEEMMKQGAEEDDGDADDGDHEYR